MISILRWSKPASFMHWIRSSHVHGTAIPDLEYHLKSTVWTNCLLSVWFFLRILATDELSLSSRLAKLSQVVGGCKAIKLEMLWLPNPTHFLIIIMSFQEGAAAGRDKSVNQIIQLQYTLRAPYKLAVHITYVAPNCMCLFSRQHNTLIYCPQTHCSNACGSHFSEDSAWLPQPNIRVEESFMSMLLLWILWSLLG